MARLPAKTYLPGESSQGWHLESLTLGPLRIVLKPTGARTWVRLSPQEKTGVSTRTLQASSDFSAGACRNPGPWRLLASTKQVPVRGLPPPTEAAPL